MQIYQIKKEVGGGGGRGGGKGGGREGRQRLKELEYEDDNIN